MAPVYPYIPGASSGEASSGETERGVAERGVAERPDPPYTQGVMTGDERLRKLPKVELHRHLDGSVRISTIWEIARENGLHLGVGTLAELERAAVIRGPMRDLTSVLACFATQQAVLCSFDAISRIAFENVEDAWRDGVKLAELRFAPAYIAAGKAISNDQIIAAVVDGVMRAMARWPMEIGLIGILPRSFPLEANAQATRDLVRWRKSGAKGADRICGFDLADREEGVDPRSLAPLVEEARTAGMGITIHSGENTDAAHVAAALDVYRPSRIGHGIRSVEDPRVMRRLIRDDVLLEVCPTSNWITSAVPSLAAHPLPVLYREGVPVCLNSDDPNLFGIDLVAEYAVCEREFGFGEREFSNMNRAALRHSFLPESVKGSIAKEL
jgi:adenosine deaminase